MFHGDFRDPSHPIWAKFDPDKPSSSSHFFPQNPLHFPLLPSGSPSGPETSKQNSRFCMFRYSREVDPPPCSSFRSGSSDTSLRARRTVVGRGTIEPHPGAPERPSGRSQRGDGLSSNCCGSKYFSVLRSGASLSCAGLSSGTIVCTGACSCSADADFACFVGACATLLDGLNSSCCGEGAFSISRRDRKSTRLNSSHQI